MLSRILLSLAVLCTWPTAGYGKAQYSYEDFQKIISVTSQVIPYGSEEQALLLAVLPGDQYPNLYKLDFKTLAFEKLYDAGQGISSLTADDTRQNFYLSLDNNGDENTQIYRFDLKTKKAQQTFGHKGYKAYPVQFSKDGKRVYLMSNHKDKATYSLYRLDLTTGKSTMLTDGRQSFDYAIISPNEKNIILAVALGNNDISLHKLDLKSKSAEPFLKRKATVFSAEFFSPDNKYLYLTTDDNSDRQYCAKVDLNNAKSLKAVYQDKNKDISCGYIEEANLSYYRESFDGKRKLRVFSGIFDKEILLPIAENSVTSSFIPLLKSKKALARITSSNNPGDYFLIDLTLGKKGSPKAITKLNQSQFSEKDFANSYDLNFKSFDGLPVHAIYFAKDEWLKTPKTKRPVILWPHGGPDSHVEHVYSSIFQYWALNGYVVLAPNFRGSTGYGKKFEILNDKDWGGGHIKDLIWAKRAMEKLNFIDKDRIYIVGASFGGFSTLSTITQYPKEFKGAVAIVALANLFTFMKSIPADPAWQAEFITEVGDPVKDKKLYEERSPYFHAEKIAIPLKIYQAENDVRTVKAEMDQFVAKLKKADIPVSYEVLEKDGHSISRSENRTKVFEGVITFLNSLTNAKS